MVSTGVINGFLEHMYTLGLVCCSTYRYSRFFSVIPRLLAFRVEQQTALYPLRYPGLDGPWTGRRRICIRWMDGHGSGLGRCGMINYGQYTVDECGLDAVDVQAFTTRLFLMLRKKI